MTGLSLRFWHDRGKAPVEGGGALAERLIAAIMPALSKCLPRRGSGSGLHVRERNVSDLSIHPPTPYIYTAPRRR